MRNLKTRANTLLLFQEGREFCVIDTETTGLSPVKDYIVEFSAKKYKIHNGKMEYIDELDVFMKPPIPMPEKASEINGITDDFLKDKKSEEEECIRIRDYISELILIGYNVGYDIKMLKSMFARQEVYVSCKGCLDVLEMARDIISKKEAGNHKLSNIAHIYGVDEGIQFHSSIDDVEVTARLLQVFHDIYMEQKSENEDKIRLCINYTYFWNGFRKEQAGIYINTNLGRVYFSTFKKEWCSSAIDLSQVDVDALEEDVLARFGITYQEFSKLTENKFNYLKQTKKQAGIYI